MKELEKRCGEKNFENLKFKILEKRCWLVGLGSGAGWPFRRSAILLSYLEVQGSSKGVTFILHERNRMKGGPAVCCIGTVYQ